MKTLAKPLSKRIKHDFSRFDLTQRLLVGIGQVNHQITSRMTIWSAGYKVRSITPLEEERALKEGAEFLGETVVFVVSGGAIVYEYNRSQAKSEEKEEMVRAQAKAEREALQAQLHAIGSRLQALEDEIKKTNQTSTNMRAETGQTRSWWRVLWGSAGTR